MPLYRNEKTGKTPISLEAADGAVPRCYAILSMRRTLAGMAELADAADSKSAYQRSNPL